MVAIKAMFFTTELLRTQRKSEILVKVVQPLSLVIPDTIEQHSYSEFFLSLPIVHSYTPSPPEGESRGEGESISAMKEYDSTF